jgi:cell division protein FtsL
MSYAVVALLIFIVVLSIYSLSLGVQFYDMLGEMDALRERVERLEAEALKVELGRDRG